MDRHAFVLWLAFGGGAAAPLGAQAPVALSFSDAVSRAARTAPTVEMAGLQVSAAEARIRQARGALLPSLSLSGAWVNRSFNSKSLGIEFPTIPGQPPFPELVPPFSNYDARVTATQTLVDFASMARIRAARAQAEGTGAERSVVVEGSARNAAIAYLRAARAAAQATARRADSVLAAELVRLAAAQKAAGVSAAIDLTRARTQLAVAEALLIVAQNQDDRARLDLGRALGLDATTPITLTDTLSSAMGAADVPADRDAAIARGVETRADLRAEIARGVAARRIGSAIAAERLPRLSLEGDFGVNGPTVPRAIATRQIALAVSIPILDGLRREGRLAEQGAIAHVSSCASTTCVRDRRGRTGRTAGSPRRGGAAGNRHRALAAGRGRAVAGARALRRGRRRQHRSHQRAGVAAPGARCRHRCPLRRRGGARGARECGRRCPDASLGRQPTIE